MARDPFYNSRAWRELRAAALHRDCHTCVTPGCRRRAEVVDHIVPRKAGGSDSVANLRSLCRTCDNQAHREKGSRGRPGTAAGAPRVERITVPGCNAEGLPRDPAHPWNRPKG